MVAVAGVAVDAGITHDTCMMSSPFPCFQRDLGFKTRSLSSIIVISLSISRKNQYRQSIVLDLKEKAVGIIQWVSVRLAVLLNFILLSWLAVLIGIRCIFTQATDAFRGGPDEAWVFILKRG